MWMFWDSRDSLRHELKKIRQIVGTCNMDALLHFRPKDWDTFLEPAKVTQLGARCPTKAELANFRPKMPQGAVLKWTRVDQASKKRSLVAWIDALWFVTWKVQSGLRGGQVASSNFKKSWRFKVQDWMAGEGESEVKNMNRSAWDADCAKEGHWFLRLEISLSQHGKERWWHHGWAEELLFCRNRQRETKLLLRTSTNEPRQLPLDLVKGKKCPKKPPSQSRCKQAASMSNLGAWKVQLGSLGYSAVQFLPWPGSLLSRHFRLKLQAPRTVPSASATAAPNWIKRSRSTFSPQDIALHRQRLPMACWFSNWEERNTTPKTSGTIRDKMHLFCGNILTIFDHHIDMMELWNKILESNVELGTVELEHHCAAPDGGSLGTPYQWRGSRYRLHPRRQLPRGYWTWDRNTETPVSNASWLKLLPTVFNLALALA